MFWRATWVCAVFVVSGALQSIAICQDDLEIPGLGNRRAFGGNFLVLDPIEAVAVPPAPPVDEDLPDDAKALLEAHEKEAVDIRRKAELEISNRRDKTIKALKQLQDKYTKDAKLDEAVAIRDKIRKLSVAHLRPTRNPGNLSGYQQRIDQTFFFDVTGAGHGSIWGTEIYTCDSSLAAAAVHAGVLKVGQRGIVKVTILRSPNEHIGSAANGFVSGNWGPFAASYTVESPQPTDVSTSDVPANQ
jgi:hypothetical protein